MSEEELFEILKERFETNMKRHKNIEWKDVENKLKKQSDKIKVLIEMEQSGGEPDVVEFDSIMGEYIFYDCSKETPVGRRNVCYDYEGEQIRIKKGIQPSGNAIDMALKMGAEILTEEEYRKLQMLEEFDNVTSSWIKTPGNIRKLGGAIFGDCHYKQVFIYHNTAKSFYSSRGFRCSVRV